MKRIDFVLFLIILMLLTASWDTFMQVTIGGFNFRFTQIACMILIPITFVQICSQSKQTHPLGFWPLLTWVLFMIIFIPNTTFILRSVLYVVWLIFSVVSIYIFVQLIQTPKRLEQVIRWYIYSFTFIAFFGIIQFLAALFGKNILVQQWFIEGRLARINGFNYEPSFFAMYLVQGFIFIAYLRKKKSQILSYTQSNICYFFIITSLILSTSRSGWVILILWFTRPIFIFFLYFFQGRLYPSYLKKALMTLSLVVANVLILFLIADLFSLEVLFSGIGFLGTSNHSTSIRWANFEELATIFMRSPLIGYSLGGLVSAVGALKGVIVTTNDQAKAFENSGLALEVLAASGVVGFIPFLAYTYTIFVKPWNIAKKMAPSETRNILIGLVVSLFFSLIIIQGGQNILRISIWYHIALISAAYAVSKKIFQHEEYPERQNDLA